MEQDMLTIQEHPDSFIVYSEVRVVPWSLFTLRILLVPMLNSRITYKYLTRSLSFYVVTGISYLSNFKVTSKEQDSYCEYLPDYSVTSSIKP